MKMKTLLLVSLVGISSLVEAGSKRIESANNAGGKIVLTGRASERCKGDWAVAYATTSTGQVAFGCWNMIDDRFVVIYDDGAQRMYDPKGFRIIDSADTAGSSSY